MAISVLGKKVGGLWISGQISKDASEVFEARRKELRALIAEVNGKPGKVSNANVVEYLLRGRGATRVLLLGMRKGKA